MYELKLQKKTFIDMLTFKCVSVFSVEQGGFIGGVNGKRWKSKNSRVT